MASLRNLIRTLKIFLVGGFLGFLMSIMAKIMFEPFATAIKGLLQGKASLFPMKNPNLLFSLIFLNNALVAILASIGSAGMILLTLWGREKFSFWRKMDESNTTESIDKYVWSAMKKFKPRLEKIKEKTDKDLFFIVYGLPSIILIVNGWFLGFLSGEQFIGQGIASDVNFLGFIIWLLPHGIIEIPAILIAAGLGFSYADRISNLLEEGKTQIVRKKSRLEIRKKETIKKLIIILIILAIASYVETFITPKVADFLIPKIT